ncbi:MAG TPA: MarR family transcriptional regulator [Allosphingosinicella sp.]
MSRRPPLAAADCADIPLVHLAATAQMLADRLAAAAERSPPETQRPRLQLVGANDAPRAGGESLAVRTRHYLKARRLRESLFPEGLFADPAWDMLLDLFASRLEGHKVCVSSACSAASVPQTTALRWVDRLEECGLVVRRPDPQDSRRIYVELTELANWRIELWIKATFQAAAPT